MAVPVEVIQVGRKLGIKGVTKVRCRVLDGRDKGKVISRNVVGPVFTGDILLLKQTVMGGVSDWGRR